MISGISIALKQIYGYHKSIACGLVVLGPKEGFPLVVGCSIRAPNREIIDMQARWLKSPGLALWKVGTTDKCYDPIFKEWYGQIIFAVYRDATFRERCSDTGWISWSTPWMIGSSTVGLDMQDEAIHGIYGKRLDVWTPLK